MKKHLIISIWIIASCAILNAQPVISQKGMVASAHELASKAGIAMLQKGGNAVDAAVATAFALAAVEPNASGLGGGGYLVLKMSGQDPVFIDYREKAPGAAIPELFYKADKPFSELSQYGGKSICVPGMVAGLISVHKKYGSLSPEDVLQPAVNYCQNGFTISDKLAAIILEKYDYLSANPEAASIYLQDLLPPPAGYVLKNPELAESVKQIIKNGRMAFYHGEIAQAVVQSAQEHGGLMDLDDLSSYQPVYGKPVYGTYRGYEIYSAAPSSGGGTHLIEYLNILESFDLKKMQHNSPGYIHTIAEAMKIILKDKSEYMCDPAFGNVPVDMLTDKNYAAKLRNFIDPDKAGFDYIPGMVNFDESGSTTHLSVVDSERNIVALTQSINYWFAAGIVAEGTGIMLNNHMADFDDKAGLPNSVEPGKRPVSSIAPTILFKDGKPFLTIGTPGGVRIIGALAQIIINIIDFEMGIDDAIAAPRIHAIGKYLYLEGRINRETGDKLIEMGHNVRYKENFDAYFGGAQGILINSEKNELTGGADPRRDGVAVGY